jgi:hypothetical protein
LQLAETTASYSRATNLLYADKNLKTLENIVEYSGLDVQFRCLEVEFGIAFLQNYVKNQRITLKKFYIESYFKY